jgi:hypothetical protein
MKSFKTPQSRSVVRKLGVEANTVQSWRQVFGNAIVGAACFLCFGSIANAHIFVHGSYAARKEAQSALNVIVTTSGFNRVSTNDTYVDKIEWTGNNLPDNQMGINIVEMSDSTTMRVDLYIVRLPALIDETNQSKGTFISKGASGSTKRVNAIITTRIVSASAGANVSSSPVNYDTGQWYTNQTGQSLSWYSGRPPWVNSYAITLPGWGNQRFVKIARDYALAHEFGHAWYSGFNA